MSESAATSFAGRLRALQWPGTPNGVGWRGWLPTWSVPALMRAVRATLVVPVLFAICLKVIGNPQMTLFAVFGGFASLLLASFGGTRRDKAVAHLGLAVVGSLALIIGTLVSGTTWLAIGAGTSLFTGRGVAFSATRQVLIGYGAAAITFAIGRFVGVSLGG